MCPPKRVTGNNLVLHKALFPGGDMRFPSVNLYFTDVRYSVLPFSDLFNHVYDLCLLYFSDVCFSVLICVV